MRLDATEPFPFNAGEKGRTDMQHWSRRKTLLACSSVALLVPGTGLAAARIPTPASTEGPFYPDQLPLRTDNDLVTIADGGKLASGEIFHLAGRVMDTSGAPLSGIAIEIWQCDANGIYRHSGDSRRGTFDVNFQGFGKTTTNDAGAYRFRTITPVSYPGRAPHIHFKVKAPNRQVFTSQLYLAGHPANNADFLFNRLQGRRAREAASIRQIRAPELDSNALKGTFDIVLG